MDKHEKQLTIATYDESAAALAEYFAGIGARTEDIDRAFSLVDQHRPTIVEIGCGDGRDAAEILKRECDYLGFDISQGMVNEARRNIPGAIFRQGDLNTFSIPYGTDIIFAFASLLHSKKAEVKSILDRAHTSLSRDGVFYISLKMDNYHKFVKEDEFGIRYFYAYLPGDIKELAGERYETVFEDTQKIGNTDWFTLALQKT